MGANVVAALLIIVAAVASERLTDRDIKELFERINQDRDRFEDQLDGKLKRDVLRGPAGEVDVERFLEDLQNNVGRMKDRFSDDYSASTEVTTVLRQGTDINRHMASLPPNFKGASEWNRLAAALKALADAYSTSFPMLEGATARRMNDRELHGAAAEIAKAGDRLKKAIDQSLKNNKAVSAATRDAALAQVEAFKNTARMLADRLDEGKPASGEAKAVIDQFVALRAASAAWGLSAPAQTELTSIRNQLSALALGFRLDVPGTM